MENRWTMFNEMLLMRDKINDKLNSAYENRLKTLDDLVECVFSLKRRVRKNRDIYTTLKHAEELLNVMFSNEEVIDALNGILALEEEASE